MDKFFGELTWNRTCGRSPLKAADTKSEFKITSDEEIKCLIENNSNLNTKRTTSTWLNHYKKRMEHKVMQTDLADVPKYNYMIDCDIVHYSGTPVFHHIRDQVIAR